METQRPAPDEALIQGGLLDLEDLSDDAKSSLLRAVTLRLEHLASEESLQDGEASQAHATALGILVDMCPGILKLEGQPAGG